MSPAELDAKRDELAEKYGKQVQKQQVLRMPAHFATGEFPTYKGGSDFATKTAFQFGFDAAVALLQPSGG